MRLLITGGTGTLGRHVVDAIRLDGRAIGRAMSRTPADGPMPPGSERAVADIDAGTGLTDAVAEVDAIIHLTHTDAEATARLLDAARDAGVRHVTYISIVGTDRIHTPYYEMKLAVEEAVRTSGLDHWVLRATQFHAFVDAYLRTLVSLPVTGLFPAEVRFQTVDEAEVAEVLVSGTLDPSGDRPNEMAGPQLLTLAAMASTWFEARSMPRVLLPGAPVASGAYEPVDWARPAFDGFVAANNAPSGDYRRGTVSWRAYLRA